MIFIERSVAISVAASQRTLVLVHIEMWATRCYRLPTIDTYRNQCCRATATWKRCTSREVWQQLKMSHKILAKASGCECKTQRQSHTKKHHLLLTATCTGHLSWFAAFRSNTEKNWDKCTPEKKYYLESMVNAQPSTAISCVAARKFSGRNINMRKSTLGPDSGRNDYIVQSC